MLSTKPSRSVRAHRQLCKMLSRYQSLFDVVVRHVGRCAKRATLRFRLVHVVDASLRQPYSFYSCRRLRLTQYCNALVEVQADDDPPEELLEAAERACEFYDNAIRNTDALRQQYLAFCETVSFQGGAS